MNETPLDGYKKISVTVLSALLSVILLFVKDPVHAQTLEQFWAGVLTPLVPAIIGIIYTAVQGNIDKEKVKVSAGNGTASGAVAGGGIAEAVPVQPVQPAVSIIPPAPVDVSVDTVNYVPVDCDVYLAKAEEAIRKDGLQVNPLNRAYYFWSYAVNFDLRVVPRMFRVDEAKKLMNKCLDLFSEAFKYQTGLSYVPSPVQASSLNTFMLKLKKDYEKANNLTCSDKNFSELRNMVNYFHDIYTALEGLEALTGKTVDWSVYGSSAYTPTQIGWDFAMLL